MTKRRYTYDERGRVWSETNRPGESKTYDYCPTGWVRSTVDFVSLLVDLPKLGGQEDVAIDVHRLAASAPQDRSRSSPKAFPADQPSLGARIEPF